MFDTGSAGKTVLGVIHLKPLAGSPDYGGLLEPVLTAALVDATALAEGGVDGIVIENFGDAPFYPGRVPAETVTQMTAAVLEVRRWCDLPVGVNVLRNDGVGALAVAAATGAEFIRVNILCGARVADQGVIQGVAHEVLRARASLGAGSVRILADVAVKHSAPLAPYPLEDEVRDVIARGKADAVIVTGSGTGHAADPGELRRVPAAAGSTPVLIGSGVTAESVEELLGIADGCIVGTAVKRNGLVTEPVDADRVRELVQRVRALKT